MSVELLFTLVFVVSLVACFSFEGFTSYADKRR